MTNETFLLNWLLDTLTKPMVASEPDRYGIAICIGFTILLIVGCIIVKKFCDYHYEALAFVFGIFGLVGVLLTLITFLGYKKDADKYELYLSQQQQNNISNRGGERVRSGPKRLLNTAILALSGIAIGLSISVLMR